ncbi:mannosyl-oligosaccharide alpha-1,2-mannosidase IA [Drosophila serrata]|uniref:mannosyl-oligosaccharide alpha-1,2-mannosidase IA n=1 Tax=Drosophila serrata TaxID=7274 RepID=UPI000A1D2D93|nr:mannosyl-oligosaccharide alpha-1,2-mannosidase IA [Drosophila serrata]
MYFFIFTTRRAYYKWHTTKKSVKILYIAMGTLIIALMALSLSQEEKDKVKDIDAIEETPEAMRRKIKEMMLHAWRNYARLTWGTNEYRPITQSDNFDSEFGHHKLGATIIESMDTLFVMGLDKELNQSREWIQESFTLDNVDQALSIFELTSRMLGPMLAMYALTGDELYRDKAIHIADKILPAFQTPTGIPKRFVVPNDDHFRKRSLPDVARTAEFGALHLEFFYLSEITGNPVYKNVVDGIRRLLADVNKPNGLYPDSFCTKYGRWETSRCSINRFHDYLLKSWMQSGWNDSETLEVFKDAMLAVVQNMVEITTEDVIYMPEVVDGARTDRMKQSDCFAAGLFAQGAEQTLMKHWAKYAQIGIGIGDTCHDLYRQSPTGLGPEEMGFSEESREEIVSLQRTFYALRPEIVESYLKLWRLSRDKKYREWGRELVLALEKYCRTPYGYAGIQDVYNESSGSDDVQRTYFLGATLKYLFLLFSEDEVFPLQEWVFNSAGHVLPIKGVNPKYRLYNSTEEENKG